MRIFKPKGNFTGYVSSIQGRDPSKHYDLWSSEFYSNGFNVKNMFNYSHPNPAAVKGNKTIVFHFKKVMINITHYEIMQRSDVHKVDYTKKWVLQGSSDANKWIDLDTRSFDKADKFINNSQSMMFECNVKAPFSYYRLINTDDSVANFVFQRLEVYGNIIGNYIKTCNHRSRVDLGLLALIFIVSK